LEKQKEEISGAAFCCRRLRGAPSNFKFPSFGGVARAKRETGWFLKAKVCRLKAKAE
jgi:hypothetical protein